MPTRGQSDTLRDSISTLAEQVAEAVRPAAAPALSAAVAAPRGGALATVDGAGTLPRAFRPRRARPGREPAPADAHGTQDQPTEVVHLVQEAKDGDAEAFAGLYDRYFDVVYRYVYYRVGSHPAAEDLASETFLRALRRLDSFTWQGRDFGAWLVTIARNLVTDHFKSSRYRLEVTTADMLDGDRVQEGPENAVLQSLANDTLIEAVKRLGAEQQECIVLRFLQGMSVAETAQIMDRASGAIKALQYRAVRSLARILPAERP
ncbi:MAG: ECF subfamily RNA polymerase sigma factor, BldN family [Streptosporangiales bacterium]